MSLISEDTDPSENRAAARPAAAGQAKPIALRSIVLNSIVS